MNWGKETKTELKCMDEIKRKWRLLSKNKNDAK